MLKQIANVAICGVKLQVSGAAVVPKQTRLANPLHFLFAATACTRTERLIRI